MKAIILFLNIFLIILTFATNANAEVCTPVNKPTKFVVSESDQIAKVLKIYQLEPVLGEGGTLEKVLQDNNLVNQDLIDPGTEVVLPFSCEEQTNGWKMLDRGEDRLITLEKIDLKDKAIGTETIDSSQKTIDILNNDVPTDPQVDTDSVAPDGEISEALRYRMICDGEWTGTECITRYSTLYVLGGAWYNRYDGTDATTGGQGVLLSKLNPELGFGWSNYWYENFRTDLGLSVINNEIHPEVRERPIEQNKKQVTSVFANMRFETGKWGFTFGLVQTEKLFYRFSTQNIVLFDDGGVVVNAVPILIYRAGGSYMFHQTGKYRFDAEFALLSLQATNTSGYNVSPGSGWDISVTVQHDRVKEYLFGTLKYEESHQDTDILLQKAKELGIKFGYAWKLKDW